MTAQILAGLAAQSAAYTGMNAVIYGYPPAVWEYARRVGRETVLSVEQAAEDGRRLLLAGFESHLRATASCSRLPLRQVALPDMSTARSVGSAAASVIDLADSLELRTPPSEWTCAPPRDLFEPRDPVEPDATEDEDDGFGPEFEQALAYLRARFGHQ